MSASPVSAPGKAFLSGEYAVTEGAPAVIAAVGRRVFAHWDGTGDGYPPGPEAEAALGLAEEAFGRAAGAPTLHRGELFRRETKLGLGSSAASAVAVAGAVAALRGHDLREPGVRDQVFEVALAGHERVAPEGSGADVASATYGGFVVFERSSHAGTRVDIVQAPASLVLSLVWTGVPVRTSDFLRRVKRLRSSNPSAYGRARAALHVGAEEFLGAFLRGKVGALIEAARAYHEAMGALGHAADVPIVDARLEQLARAAAEEGGAAKPCGAGGGDVALAFFDNPEAARRFERRCTDEGFTPIDVKWGAEGVRTERSSRHQAQ